MASEAFRRELRAAIAVHLERIEKLFMDPVKVSLLIRNPAHPNGSRDVYLSSDEGPEVAIAAIRQVMTVGEETPSDGG